MVYIHIQSWTPFSETLRFADSFKYRQPAAPGKTKKPTIKAIWCEAEQGCTADLQDAWRRRRFAEAARTLSTAAPMEEEQRTFWGCAGCKGGATTVDVVNWQSWQGSRSPGIDHCEHVLFELPCKESADEDLQGISRAVAQCQTWLGVSPGTLGNGRKKTGRAFPKRQRARAASDSKWCSPAALGFSDQWKAALKAWLEVGPRDDRSGIVKPKSPQTLVTVSCCVACTNLLAILIVLALQSGLWVAQKRMKEAREANGLSHL